MGFFDPIKRKVGNVFEDMERNRKEDDEFRRQRHEVRMSNAKKRAEALENANLQHELKEARSGKRKEGGIRDMLGNFSEGMLRGGPSGMGYNSDFVFGEKRRSGKKHRKSKKRK